MKWTPGSMQKKKNASVKRLKWVTVRESLVGRVGLIIILKEGGYQFSGLDITSRVRPERTSPDKWLVYPSLPSNASRRT